ncbi:PAAR domain-containing protein [Xenorhabdus bovienii]|uniref:PAAR domain-containing protein n=1 Tax=Xenorhabdus bovienii TaxID=40576 RepID=UPI0023B25147|nr:PAAR domain-containing protein [Xenorhabdus bovienii]MDE9436125.1 PAAR domain-containing protein [Xenorhabdus bovienii]MDE9499774.1 PAAR domain-containing protein [Xenorhabdus bovienii]
MRVTIDGKKIILKGDTTNTGGKVLTGSGLTKQGEPVACVGDSVFCPACKSTGTIVEGASLTKIEGKMVALEGYKVDCGCPSGCSLVATG